MKIKERTEYLLQKLDHDNILNLSEIVQETGGSEATIRRDLQRLEDEGKLKRIPGGAIKPVNVSVMTQNHEIGMFHRMLINPESKERVAKAACESILDGECVFLDGGSSIVPMIRYLKNRPVRIVTHNHLVIAQLGDHVKADIVTIGGAYAKEYAMSVGPDAVRQIKEYYYDRCFISCVAFHLQDNMTYTTETDTKEMKLAAMQNADHSYLLVDHSKEDLRAFCRFTPLTSFDVVYDDIKDANKEYPENFKFASSDVLIDQK